MVSPCRWSILETNLIFENKWLTVYQDKVKTNSGKIMHYTWYRASDVVVIVPFINNDTLVVIRQFRYPLKKILLEFPAGHIEDGEVMEKTAKRELLEETGYSANQMRHVYSYHPSVSKSRQTVHVFTARHLIEDRPSNNGTEDITKVEKISVNELKDLIRKGKIESAGTLIAYFVCCSLN